MKMSETIKTKIQKHSRTLFILLAWILLLGLFTQISLAGLAIFYNGELWAYHKALVSIMEFVPVIMFVFACIGEIHKMFRTLTFMLFFIINFQYYTTNGWLGAIHAVFTLVIFMMTLFIAWGSYRGVLSNKKENNDSKQELQYTGTGI
jgi:hypothetical protein